MANTVEGLAEAYNLTIAVSCCWSVVVALEI